MPKRTKGKDGGSPAKPKRNPRAKSSSPVSFKFCYKDSVDYNATTAILEEELRSDKTLNWKPKPYVTSTISVMGPVQSLVHARGYDNHLNRALVADPFIEYESNKRESKIRSSIIESFDEPVTIQQITAALGIVDCFFSNTVKDQRVSSFLDRCIRLKPILTNPFSQTRAKNAGFDIFMRSAAQLLQSRFGDVTSNSSFADVFPLLIKCGILSTREKPQSALRYVLVSSLMFDFACRDAFSVLTFPFPQ